MSTEFVAPSWLNDQDAETIHKRMMAALPVDIDDTEAGFQWDLTKPSALELSLIHISIKVFDTTAVHVGDLVRAQYHTWPCLLYTSIPPMP